MLATQGSKDQERIARYHELFRVEGGKLIRKVDRSKAKKGDVVGTNSRGYLVCRVDKKCNFVHRIIFEMAYGPIAGGFEIDHANGVRNDNRIENLRLATRVENRQNSCPRKDSKTGIRGVMWHHGANKRRATIRVCGKPKHLGLFSDIEDARAARLAAERELFGDFAPSVCRVSC